MIKFSVILALISFQAWAYIPTVESLFRHGPNPDVNANGVAVTLVVKKIEPSGNAQNAGESSLLTEVKAEDFYKIFFTRINSETMRVAQSRYDNASFNEASLIGKIYIPNFTAYTIKPSVEESEKAIFHAMLRSLVFNDGAFLVNYLKSMNVPVKLNNEIINREKVEYLAAYKQYLVAISKDRNLRKTEKNPLKPDDATAREKIDLVMNSPMYVDQGQVRLSREDGDISWLITAEPFEAVVSYKEREIRKIKFKSQLGEYEIICKDYWLANGTHSMPRFMIVKDYKGESFQVEVLNLRQYLEKETDLINRLKKWDTLLKGKESHVPRPAFLL